MKTLSVKDLFAAAAAVVLATTPFVGLTLWADGESPVAAYSEREIHFREFLSTSWKEIGELRSGESFGSFFYGVVDGKQVNDVAKNEAAVPYIVKTNENVVSVQFQFMNGGALACVMVELKTEDSKLYARAVNGKFTSGKSLGFDFSTGGTSLGVATSETAAGYGIKILAVKVRGPAKPELPRKEIRLTYEGTLGSGWVKVAQVEDGARFVSFDSALSSGTMVTVGRTCTPCFQKDNPPVSTVQFQFFDGPLKCVTVAAQVIGDTVWMKHLYGYYKSGPSIGYDFETNGGNGNASYNVKSVEFTLSIPCKQGLVIFLAQKQPQH